MCIICVVFVWNVTVLCVCLCYVSTVCVHVLYVQYVCVQCVYVQCVLYVQCVYCVLCLLYVYMCCVCSMYVCSVCMCSACVACAVCVLYMYTVCMHLVCVVWAGAPSGKTGWGQELRGSWKTLFPSDFWLFVQIRKILCTFEVSLVNRKVQYTPSLECELQFYPNDLFRRMAWQSRGKHRVCKDRREWIRQNKATEPLWTLKMGGWREAEFQDPLGDIHIG